MTSKVECEGENCPRMVVEDADEDKCSICQREVCGCGAVLFSKIDSHVGTCYFCRNYDGDRQQDLEDRDDEEDDDAPLVKGSERLKEAMV